jgi:hypothetical protein
MNLAFIFAALFETASFSFGTGTHAALNRYGGCLALQSAKLEMSGDAAKDVISASMTACERDRVAAQQAVSADLRKRKDQYHTESTAAADGAFRAVEQKMRENLLLQIIERRAARTAKR